MAELTDLYRDLSRCLWVQVLQSLKMHVDCYAFTQLAFLLSYWVIISLCALFLSSTSRERQPSLLPPSSVWVQCQSAASCKSSCSRSVDGEATLDMLWHERTTALFTQPSTTLHLSPTFSTHLYRLDACGTCFHISSSMTLHWTSHKWKWAKRLIRRFAFTLIGS